VVLLTKEFYEKELMDSNGLGGYFVVICFGVVLAGFF
jgi:hypothetical protein